MFVKYIKTAQEEKKQAVLKFKMVEMLLWFLLLISDLIVI